MNRQINNIKDKAQKYLSRWGDIFLYVLKENDLSICWIWCRGPGLDLMIIYVYKQI